jgi:glycosyltransferase involved in cell wall biosynthesis
VFELVAVSVLMGCYNHEKYVAQAIESVLNQNFADLELIIIDDHSTDNSPKIIANYQKKDPRVRAFFHEKNMGIAKTGNECLKQVKGKYVCFLGSDDLWVKDKLEKQLRVIEKNPEKIVWAQAEIIDSQGEKTGKYITELLNAPPKKSGNLFQELLRDQFLFGQTLMLSSGLIKNIRFDEKYRYVNDHRFFVDLAANNEFVFMPEPLAEYRMHGNNATSKDEKGWLKEKILLRKYFLQQYSDRMSTETKVDIYYKIGYFLSNLGKQREAKQYFMQAFKIDHSHLNSTLYLGLALTGGKGFLGKRFMRSYYFARSGFKTSKGSMDPKNLNYS